ncbi:hypothetical protein FOMA001_g3611 [Fusarium oxysporum f. sp. matthiolae]|nr:hypothetical protein FOMA001_g3611 [Fusarium oxysporum f. sp. matthiolae]
MRKFIKPSRQTTAVASATAYSHCEHHQYSHSRRRYPPAATTTEVGSPIVSVTKRQPRRLNT